MLNILIFKNDAYITSIFETMFMTPNNLINNIDKMFEDKLYKYVLFFGLQHASYKIFISF